MADNCPRQDRTLKACHKVLEAARSHPKLLEHLIQNRKLPIAELAELSGVSRKTMERHRTYLVAILLAYTNGYEIIRGTSVSDIAGERREPYDLSCNGVSSVICHCP